MDSRYRNRRTFTTERAVEYRIVNDIELGRRDNYEQATLTSLEVAYDLPSGAIARLLAGGDPVPLQPASPVLALQGGPDDPPVPASAEFEAQAEPYLSRVAVMVLKAREEHWELPPGVPLEGRWVFADDPVSAGQWDAFVRRGRELTGRTWSDLTLARSMALLWALTGEPAQARRA